MTEKVSRTSSSNLESNFTWPTLFGSLAFIGVVYSHILPEPNQLRPWWRPQAETRRSNKVAHHPTSVAGVSPRFQPPRTFGSGWNNYLLGFYSRNEVQVMQENLQLSSCGILKYPGRSFHVLDLITGSPILIYQHHFPLLIQWGLDVKDKVLIKGEKKSSGTPRVFLQSRQLRQSQFCAFLLSLIISANYEADIFCTAPFRTLIRSLVNINAGRTQHTTATRPISSKWDQLRVSVHRWLASYWHERIPLKKLPMEDVSKWDLIWICP